MGDLLIRGDVETIDVQAEMARTKAALAVKAKLLLNYDKLTSENDKLDKERADKALATTMLGALGIQPFTQASVEKYQHKKLREMQWRYALRNFSNSDAGDAVMTIGGVLGILSTVVAAVTTGIAGHLHRLHLPVSSLPWWMKLAYALMFVGYFFWIGIASVRHKTRRNRMRFEWRKTRLSQFGQVIPDFALARAVEIKEAYPEAEFNVEWLKETQERYVPPRLQDPFLVLEVGYESFYIDVWGENDFERTV